MKKLGYLLFFFMFAFSSEAFSQSMSSDQIIAFVKEQTQLGVSQRDIAAKLVDRGVSPAQVEAAKQKYERNQVLVHGDVEDNNATASTRANPIESEIASDGFSEVSSATDSKIFGDNIFNNRNLRFEPNLNIPTPLNYRLGPGDEVVIEVWGASETVIRQQISPDGSITIQHLGPVYLNGLTIEEANKYLQDKLGNVFAGVGEGSSDIKLTLGQIRSMQVNVMGEVAVPGTYTVSSLASVFHVLYRAGGVNSIGSLRSVKVYRASKLIKDIDIYEYILDGKETDNIRLTDGDMIIVSPYGRRVDILGNVKRPMFYEMKEGETISDLIRYAGGYAAAANTQNVRLTRLTGEQNQIFTVDKKDYGNFELANGDQVTIAGGLDLFENRVEVKGAVFREGFYELGGQIKTVRALIAKADGVRGDAFLNRAILIREKPDMTTETMAIDMQSLLYGNSPDIELKKNDIVYVPSINDVSQGKSLTIHGEVPRPGAYKYSDNTTLEDLIIQAGGLLESASTVRIDIARRIMNPLSKAVDRTLSETFTFELKDGLVVNGEPSFVLQPYDEVYVRRSPGYHIQQNVTLEGEVIFPGPYALNRKTERLSDLVKRAGNITPDAYLKGARLVRSRSAEEEFRAASVMKLAKNDNKDSISVHTLDVSSRYNVGIDLELALANPGSDYDLVLRAGDRLIIPEYDNTVKINGAVMYPNTILYRKGEKLSYYINQAGGYADNAKKGKTFVVYMNGTVSKVKSGDKDAVQPGAEIVVPTKEVSNRMSLAQTIALTTSITSVLGTIAALIISITK